MPSFLLVAMVSLELFAQVALRLNPPYLYLLSGWDYRLKAPHPALAILTGVK
jgi:hypothetical protein